MKRFHWLEKIIKQNNYKTIVQVGTGKGPTSEHLLRTCPDIKLIEVAYYPGKLTEDRRDTQESHYRAWQRRIRPYRKRTVVLFGKSEEKVSDVADGSVDLVFIDADHSYEACKQDIDIWLPKVRFGGMICGHDYKHPRFPGVQKAVDEVFQGDFDDFHETDWVWSKRVV
jgi:predicted O-methyltransferase YrrM